MSEDENDYIIAPFSKGGGLHLLSFWYHFPINGDLNLGSIDIY